MVTSIVRHVVRRLAQHVAELRTPARSPHWHTLEKLFLKNNDTCAACAGNANLQVHHVMPFHLQPQLELDPRNLITLCMARDLHCHLLIGHGGSFMCYNPNVRRDAADRRAGRGTRKMLEDRARIARVR